MRVGVLQFMVHFRLKASKRAILHVRSMDTSVNMRVERIIDRSTVSLDLVLDDHHRRSIVYRMNSNKLYVKYIIKHSIRTNRRYRMGGGTELEVPATLSNR